MYRKIVIFCVVEEKNNGNRGKGGDEDTQASLVIFISRICKNVCTAHDICYIFYRCTLSLHFYSMCNHDFANWLLHTAYCLTLLLPLESFHKLLKGQLSAQYCTINIIIYVKICGLIALRKVQNYLLMSHGVNNSRLQITPLKNYMAK